MTTIRFPVVTRTAVRSGVCPLCGKPGKRQKTIEHTVSPWNTNPDGTVKTREQVYADVTALAKTWASKPFTHARCEQHPEAGR